MPSFFLRFTAPLFVVFIAGGLCFPAPTTSSSDPYEEVTLRLPDGGLSARQEMHLEVSVRDPRKSDPVMGAMPVVRAQLNAVIDMPSMAGMPKISETAHPVPMGPSTCGSIGPLVETTCCSPTRPRAAKAHRSPPLS